jgi:hypothetical protein
MFQIYCVYHSSKYSDFLKKTFQSSETENQGGIAAFESRVVTDKYCFLTFPPKATHSPKSTEIMDIKYSGVFYVVRQLYAIKKSMSF